MTRGVLLFAFNSVEYNYVKMAEFTARKAKHLLNLPCTLVTDKSSVIDVTTELFDQILIINSDSDNQIDGRIWLNKGRYRAYELSPYDETLLLDVDYVINSDKLNLLFDIMDDFMCHETISYLMYEHNRREYLNEKLSLPTLWATVIAFKKTNRVKQIFECLKMIQENYEHYANIHKFPTDSYRNDYGLTLAWRIVNGHSYVKSDIIPWNLNHIHPKTRIYNNQIDNYNTEYTILTDRHSRGKIKKEYVIIKNMDFHVINKKDFVELIK